MRSEAVCPPSASVAQVCYCGFAGGIPVKCGSCNHTIKEAAVDLSEYRDYNDACRQTGHFVDDVYIHRPIHASLGHLTPVEFEAKWRREDTLALEVELRIA